jgi:excisionase family DNA binding protein
MSEIHVDLLKPADVARRLGVSRSWLYEGAREGRVPCVRLGGTDGPLRFSEDDLAVWLEQGRSTDRRAAS